MSIPTCRVCGHRLFTEPLLHYANMPCAAQHLPDAAAVRDECGVDLDVCQCAGCGLVQLPSEPVSYYRDVIRAAGVSEEMAAFRRAQFREFVKEHSLENRCVLEIGCGCGEYLAVMQQAGARAIGLEHSEHGVARARAQGLDVLQGFIDTAAADLEGAPFDAFFMLNFLEHLPEPNATLRGIANNLVPGAPGLVEVPNFDMNLEQNLFSEFIPDHLMYFTADTLATALAVNGFEVIDCREVWHRYILSAKVRTRRPLDLSAFARERERLTTELRAYIDRFGTKRVAVWGAGHQALAVLALTGAAEHVRYVVDSASFKQGRFTPATHLPIVPPARLETDPVDAVIVMAASYSDEVAGILDETFGDSLNVVILPGALE